MDEGPSSDKMTIKRAFLWILLSVLAVSGTTTFGWLYYLHWKESLILNPQYTIRVIAQTSPYGLHLDSHFFSEVLGLSRDHPTNLYAFNIREGERRLKNHPLIKTAKIKTLSPETLHIDYEVRIPVAYLGDFVNVAIDQEGIMIPFQPFFTPKKLPKLYFGLDDRVEWGQKLTDPRLQLGHQILDVLHSRNIDVKSLDLSRIHAASYGSREIIVTIDEITDHSRVSRTLRLNHLDPFDSLEAYWTFRENSDGSPGEIIDLRIKNLAFIVERNRSVR